MPKSPEDYDKKLQELFNSLSPEDAISLKKLLVSLHGADFDEVYRRFQETRATIQQIEKRALDKLKRRPDESQ